MAVLCYTGGMTEELYWQQKHWESEQKYKYLLKNWQQQLVKEVDQERQIMERDKVIIALQDKVRKYESLTSSQSTGEV